ncbi:LysR family transcriptional regulator [Thiotrichales bacterium 19S9-12]|nr:LysR family transcriptional regulator [Thiotrichales bacterium 19S9-11]MCF6811905.1 LysR family transcriptional regulator [Thiotrichales bacterium 19S9-12]
MLPDQRDLFIFHKVALLESFTKAAENLNVSKGYISKVIARLEDQLQSKLIQRSTRQFVLTDRGEQLFITTVLMQEELSKGLEKLQVLSGVPKGKLKISAPPALTEKVLAPIISEFVEKYPEVKIDLNLETEYVDVISGGYDLIIRNGLLDDAGFIARKLLDVKVTLVSSPLLFEKYTLPQIPEDLENLPCITYGAADKVMWQFSQGKQKVSVAVNSKLTCNLSSLLKTCMLNGTGITTMPYFMVKEEIEQKKIIELLPKWEIPSTPLYLVYPSRQYMPLKTRSFMEHLISKFKI